MAVVNGEISALIVHLLNVFVEVELRPELIGAWSWSLLLGGLGILSLDGLHQAPLHIRVEWRKLLWID